ncbi:MAG: hypothetical protein IJ003_00400 [Candidatus Gastranaerophilales bacterium]|nr:hypothetical protein [Candidatus Gastranaerophilales bacterium]
MKIQSIKTNSNQNIYFKQRKYRQATPTKTYGDVFVRNLVPKMEFEEAYKDFQNRIINYIFKTRNFKNDVIEEVLKKYSSSISVKDLRKKTFSSRVPTKATGIFGQSYSIEETKNGLRAKVKNNELCVIYPKIPNKKSRLKFLENLLHEGIHFLQDSTKDRKSRVAIINELIENIKSKELATEKLNLLFSNYTETENMASSFLLNAFLSKHPRQEEITREKLNSLCIEQIKEDLETCARAIVANYLDSNSSCLDVFTKNDLLNYLIHGFNQEIEAYTLSLNTLEKYCDLNKTFSNGTATIARGRVILYKECAKVAQELKD